MALNFYLHPHALERMAERGANEADIATTLENGQRFPAKYGRTGFRHSFVFNGQWMGKSYANKEVEVYAVLEREAWTVITVIVKYY